jgi:glutamyl-tRNA synthetase/glutamyl-Q tRNA(Asp) synthetase
VLRLPAAPWRTRFAPAPTGYLHLGHAVNAIYVWGLARAAGGRVVLRIEDHDRIRSRPEYEAALLEDLEWLGLEPDERAPRQSERVERYAEILAGLEARGLAYPCVCTRREIREARPEAAGEEGELCYPGTCRARGIDPASTPIRRLGLERREVAFTDLRLGEQRQVPADQCGDLLLRDRDGNWTYQLAVVVDDLDQGIDLVIRGEDLLASTGRQIQLAEILDPEGDRKVPATFLHHPLVLKEDGSKLSKSDEDTGLGELRAAGWSPERVLGEAAYRAGLQVGRRTGARSLSARDLAEVFARTLRPAG